MDDKSVETPDKKTAQRRMAEGIAVGMGVGLVIGFIFGDESAGMIIGMGIGAAVGARHELRGRFMQYPPQALRRMAFGLIFFLVVLFGAYALLDLGLQSPWDILTALAPTLPGFYLFYVVGSAISLLEERQRQIQLEGLAVGFGIALVAALGIGMLATTISLPANWIYVTLLLVVSWGIGKGVAVIRYRGK
jgi:hypothetical protein